MTNRIFLSSPHMSDEGFEKAYIDEAFNKNWIAPLGDNVNAFEDGICKYTGIKSALATNSGTAAIHLALKAADVKENDIVICQSLTFSASANPIIYQGAIPVFVDSDFESWNINPDLLEQALQKHGSRVKAVIIVHLYGLVAEIEAISHICKKYNVTLIEDAAESLGSTYNGKHTGTFGDYGIFSFNGNKIITTSSGGMLVSNNKEKIEKARFWASQAKDKAKHYQHSELGYNYRLSNISAGIGRGQLKVLDQRVAQKNHILEFYKRELSVLDGVGFMPALSGTHSNYWLSVITLNSNMNPTDLIDVLESENIESRPIWKPMHLQPFYEKYDHIGKGVSDQLFEHGLCLPSDTKLTDDDLYRVCSVIKSVWN